MQAISELTSGIRAGSFPPEKLLQVCTRRILEKKHLNAFISYLKESDISNAVAAATRAGDGVVSREQPLHAVPVAVKDNFCVRGFPATAASSMLERFHPPYESTVTSRLKDAGAVIIGKTNMDEFGMGSFSRFSTHGAVLNPWGSTDAPRVAGGSSGGSAVAVATGMAACAIGSDTGGSVRMPASYCGVVGLKPSYGVLSRWGMISYASSLDCPGIFARNVRDAALLLQVLSGPDPHDSTCVGHKFRPTAASPTIDERHSDTSGQGAGLDALGKQGSASFSPRDAQDGSLVGVRVGIPDEYRVRELSPSVREAWRAGAAWMRERGATILPVRLSHSRAALAAYYVVAAAEAASNLARYDGLSYELPASAEDYAPPTTRSPPASTAASQGTAVGHHRSYRELLERSRSRRFGAEVRRRVLLGTFVASSEHARDYLQKATQVRQLVAADFVAAFRAVDLILAPATPTTAPLLSEVLAQANPAVAYASDVMTVPASLAGLPAISVPVGMELETGLPVSVQLIAPRFHEQALLSGANVLESSAAVSRFASFPSVGPWQGAAPLLS